MLLLVMMWLHLIPQLSVGATAEPILGLYVGVFVGDGIRVFGGAGIGDIGDTITFVGGEYSMDNGNEAYASIFAN